MTNKKGKTYKKLHRWPGLIISFLLLYFAFTGIIMNHRAFVAPLDINRKFLPAEYTYQNWNNSALKGNIEIGEDSTLLYGNIGIWLTDSTYSRFVPFTEGMRKGSDNQKTFDLHYTPAGQLYAATQFGLYAYDKPSCKWKELRLDADLSRFTGIAFTNDTLYITNRSHLFRGRSEGISTRFEKIELPAPVNYVNDVSLFETIWQIHSGEIFGLPGRLIVDILGIITIFLSLTGIIYFFFPTWIIKRARRDKKFMILSLTNKWSLKWHNKIGAWTFVLLVVLYLSGMFLRPPVLIAIANSRVKPITYSHLDQANPWYDKLRDIKWDEQDGIFLLSTSHGMYHFKKNNLKPVYFKNQPPVSVMGINVFEPYINGSYLIGSFSGLFIWHPASPDVLDIASGKPYVGNPSGRPVGTFKVTGILSDTRNRQFMIDYDKGAIPIWHNTPPPAMPKEMIRSSTISLWNFSLEMHTGRLFAFLLGDFYILIVPVVSLASIVVVISGYLLWRKKYRKVRMK